MTTQNDGGPAFPVAEVRDCNGNGITEGAPGMSLRDYFAAQALMGFAASEQVSMGPNDAAHTAYLWANAMLAARRAPR